MIIDAILTIVIAFITLIIDLLTSLIPAVPGWFTDAAAGLGTVVGYMWQLDAWLPVGMILTIAGAVLAAWAAAVVVGGVRWIVSYFFGGGGAT